MDMLTNAGYNVGRGSSSTGAVDNVALNKTTGITDAQVQSEIQSLINSGALQAPDSNRLYVINVEPGVVVHNGSGASNTAFLGYHGAFAGKTASGAAVDIHYAVIPAPGAPNFTSASQGFSSNFDEITSVTSHELAEAVTDPNVNYKALGWYDDQKNGEIGDLTRLNTVMSGYLVQDVVNKNDQPIAPASRSAPTPTPTPPPSTLSAPQNVSISALSTTTAQLSWSGVSGTQGYRIFQVNGSQSVLLGTVNATTTSVQINGAHSGRASRFKVEAYNATAVADSQVVSVTMPTPAALAAPNVTATATSSTSVALNWNSVSGRKAIGSTGGTVTGPCCWGRSARRARACRSRASVRTAHPISWSRRSTARPSPTRRGSRPTRRPRRNLWIKSRTRQAVTVTRAQRILSAPKHNSRRMGLVLISVPSVSLWFNSSCRNQRREPQRHRGHREIF